MYTREPDAAVEALDDRALLARLARTDWEHDPLFIPDEQVFRMFRRARDAENTSRAGILSRVLSRRMLGLAKGFAVRSGIYPGNIGRTMTPTRPFARSLRCASTIRQLTPWPPSNGTRKLLSGCKLC